MVVRRFLLFMLALLVTTLVNAASTDPAPGFERRSWSPVEGAPTGAWRIAQSLDGLLWFASPSGLFRFDGEKFQRVEQVYGHPLHSHNVGAVVPYRDGIALIYQFGGLSLLTPTSGRFFASNSHGLPAGVIRGLILTPEGEPCVGTSAGLAVLRGQDWHLLRDNGLPDGTLSDIALDDEGTTWVLVESELYGRPRGASQFAHLGSATPGTSILMVRGKPMIISRGHQLLQFQFGHAPTVLHNKLSTIYDGVYAGPLSTSWAWLGNGDGLVRLNQTDQGAYTVAQSFESGRADNSVVLSGLLDREDNLWFSTFNGVERYRAQRIHEFQLPASMFNFYVHRGLDDTLLATGQSADSVVRLTDAGYRKQWDLSGITAMWRESADSLWAASHSGLTHITHHGMQKWPLPPEVTSSMDVQAIITDREGVVWIAIVRRGLYRFSDGHWSHVDSSVMGTDATPISMQVAPAGHLWLGYTGNRFAQLVDGKVHPLPNDGSPGVGNVLSLLEIDGQLLAGGELGIALISPQGNQPLLPEQLKSFRGVSGLVQDHNGDLWAHGSDGIYHISKAELGKFRADPAHRVKWEVFNLTDGVRGNAAQIRPLPSLLVAPDGKIVYATNSQIGWIDPLHVRRNTRAPDVMVLSLRTAAGEFTPERPLHFAPGTTALEIRYAATALSIPEKVKLKYRLSGVDHDWQDSHGERLARYTNLAPGYYRFQVIAANEDGVWNTRGTTLTFEILPEIWQTTWFRLTVVMLTLLLLVALYRWRIAAVAARAAETTAARLEERERIARNLHDNLLQGIQALVLRCSVVLSRLPPASQEKRILEDVLDQADRLIVTTRDEVMGLRDNLSTEQIVAELCNDLEALEPLVKGRLTLHVSEAVTRLHPAVARELCQVLKEAVTNAARHSGASAISARLGVTGSEVEGSVTDNGIGIPAAIAQDGAPGHWGIIGMHERIARLGGALRIEGNANGTTLTFSVNTQHAK